MTAPITDDMIEKAMVVAERFMDYALEPRPNIVVPFDEDHRASFAEASELLVALLADKEKVREEATEVIADAQYCLAYSECTFIDESLRELWHARRFRILAFYWESP